MDTTARMLFDYLKNAIYDPYNAKLDIKGLPGDFTQFAEGLQYFAHCVLEMRILAAALSRGDLSTELPPPSNELAAPLKSLHSSLKHITWQSQQVAKGDYKQRIDFMGEFSNAFNTMIEQLDSRQQALVKEIAAGKKKNVALAQSHKLLVAIMSEIPQWIIVVDCDSKKKLFTNKMAAAAIKADRSMAKKLQSWLSECINDDDYWKKSICSELELSLNGKKRYFSVNSYPLQWQKRRSQVFVLSDISSEREQLQRLENYAYCDNLTKLYNRFYGMNMLKSWVEEKRNFCVCFVDLDNLKYVNDNFGHSEGDRYIMASADKLRSFSDEAIVCRLGGDEFMLLADNMKMDQTEQRMKQLFDELLEWDSQEDTPYMRCISYGIVEADDKNTFSASELLAIADDRMYAFKREQKTKLRNSIKKTSAL